MLKRDLFFFLVTFHSKAAAEPPLVNLHRGGSIVTTTADSSVNTPVGLENCDTCFVAECELPTTHGLFRLRSYRHRKPNGEVIEPVVMIPANSSIATGAGEPLRDTVVRVHDQCLTSEVLGSRRCDCREQLALALQLVQREGGCVVYLQQEGRGIGLANKVAAYGLQDGGLDTVDANRELGFADDERTYDCIPFILQDLRVESVRLLTNNPHKVSCLTEVGVTVSSTLPLRISANKWNRRYLATKASRMAHHLDLAGLTEPAEQSEPAPGVTTHISGHRGTP